MTYQIKELITLLKRQILLIDKKIEVTNNNVGINMDKYLPICKEVAMKYDVIFDIHPNDFIFHFLINHPGFNDVSESIEYYFDDGSKSAKKLASLITDIYGSTDTSIKMLEFASGYGCVTRHILNYLPNVTVASCDIHQEAIDFIESSLGMPAIISNTIPEKINVPKDYDIIFALSFFSHMPIKTWGRWLNVLQSKLKKGGYLIFTTHGMESRKHFNYPKISSSGFWFAPTSEQKDLKTNDYGQTIVLPNFVFNQILEQKDSHIILFREGYWWEHQDLYILKKD